MCRLYILVSFNFLMEHKALINFCRHLACPVLCQQFDIFPWFSCSLYVLLHHYLQCWTSSNCAFRVPIKCPSCNIRFFSSQTLTNSIPFSLQSLASLFWCSLVLHDSFTRNRCSGFSVSLVSTCDCILYLSG